MANLARRASRAGGGRLVLRAATNTTTLVALGAGSLAAIGLQSWPMAALALLAYLALAAWDLATPEFREKVRAGEAAEALQLPATESLLDPLSKEAVKSLVASGAERERLTREVPPHLQHFVEMALASVPELERHATVLIGRLESLTRYMSAGQKRLTDPTVLRAEVQRLEQQVSGAVDAEARAQLTLARDARQAQLVELEELSQARERLRANLTRVMATLESLPAKVLKLRTLDDASTDAVSGNVGQEIERINDELRAFEDTLRPLEERVR
jgi:hypothetical protein